MKKLAVTLVVFSLVAALAWAQGPAASASSSDASVAVGNVEGRPATGNAHLLDRGTSPELGAQSRGGTTPPTGPTPIFYPGGSTMAGAAGAPAAGLFPIPIAGGYFGNIFAPGVGFPSSFLTLGVPPGTSGFLVTGAYAWHSPFILTPGTMMFAPGGSPVRILVAAAAAPPPTAMSLAAVATGGFSIVTTTAFPGPPGPTGVVGAAGIFAGVRVGGTAMTGGPTPVTASAVFCGLVAGGPAFTPMWTGNGVGASLPPVGPGVPIRVGFFPPFFPGGPISAVTVPPQDLIAGCFADSSTTPVELMAFGVE